jgi:hypothetical protein
LLALVCSQDSAASLIAPTGTDGDVGVVMNIETSPDTSNPRSLAWWRSISRRKCACHADARRRDAIEPEQEDQHQGQETGSGSGA